MKVQARAASDLDEFDIDDQEQFGGNQVESHPNEHFDDDEFDDQEIDEGSHLSQNDIQSYLSVLDQIKMGSRMRFDDFIDEQIAENEHESSVSSISQFQSFKADESSLVFLSFKESEFGASSSLIREAGPARNIHSPIQREVDLTNS